MSDGDEVVGGSIPPPGAIAAVEYPFHVLHDVSRLAPHGETVFFSKFREFSDGSPKRYPEECNLPGEGSSLPAGTMKKIIGVSIQAMGAHDDELFEVDVVCSKQLQASLTIKSGMKEAAYLEKPVVLAGQEWFEIHVRAPERLRAERAYSRVTLHGPFSISLQ